MVNKLNILGPEKNFLGLEERFRWDEAEVVFLPVPLELTTTYIQGTGRGPDALLEASHQVELYDDELKTETWKHGLATLKPIKFKTDSPGKAVAQIEECVEGLLKTDKKIVSIGGEHTVTVGTVRAFAKRYPGMSVLQLDAHADLRNVYEASPLNHACVMARVAEVCPFVGVGIRSLCVEEAERIKEGNLSIFDAHRMRKENSWMESALSALTDVVYITLDLDVFDPAVLPAVGTPEPGGMDWEEVTTFLKLVFERKRVVGFDVLELCPRPGADYGVFTAAKLLYRMLGYWLT